MAAGTENKWVGRPDRARRRYAVIPTASRPDDFYDCVGAVVSQVDVIFAVCNGGRESRAYVDRARSRFSLGKTGTSLRKITWQRKLPNISVMWNLGLEACAADAREEGFGDAWDAAVLNDDVLVMSGWMDEVVGAMDRDGTVLGAPPRQHNRRQPAGYAFVLRGESGIRADERFVWWFGDSDIAMQARTGGQPGFSVVETDEASVIHRYPGETTTGRLLRQARLDAAEFQRKWAGRKDV